MQKDPFLYNFSLLIIATITFHKYIYLLYVHRTVHRTVRVNRTKCPQSVNFRYITRNISQTDMPEMNHLVL